MKVEAGSTLSWSEIDLAPETPGVYAWYVQFSIGRADIEGAIKRTVQASEASEQAAWQEVEATLERFVFEPFRESPYHVSLQGQLKPTFKGEVFHEPSKSDSLISRLVRNPERFRTIADVL